MVIIPLFTDEMKPCLQGGGNSVCMSKFGNYKFLLGKKTGFPSMDIHNDSITVYIMFIEYKKNFDPDHFIL